jgi:hypothetical protein
MALSWGWRWMGAGCEALCGVDEAMGKGLQADVGRERERGWVIDAI